MLEFSPAHLADGQLPSSKGTLYTVPALNVAILKSIVLVNTDTVNPMTVNLYANFGTGSRRITPADMVLPPGAKYSDDSNVTLEAGDILEASCSSSAKVDYSFGGVLTVNT
jgi:hypothetical protein